VDTSKVINEKLSPVVDPSPDTLEEGIALCLSGGGYRAMMFHVGCLWRLNEAGLLGKLSRVSSVSGGSITAAVLGMNWEKLQFTSNGTSEHFGELLVKPIRKMASTTIDESSILGGIFLPGTISEHIAKHYKEILFGDATLQNLPDDTNLDKPAPRFVINATNVQSGVLMRFSRPYIWDYKVGRILSPKLPLALAVTASSAFPPILSPCEIDLSDFGVRCLPVDGKEPLSFEPYISKLVLSDGGVYDNLGLETAWKRYRTILVSDGGGHYKPEPSPHHDWARHAFRILDLIDSQVRALRTRQIMGLLELKERLGSYWSIRQDIGCFAGASPSLPCPEPQTRALAEIPTRLKQMDENTQDCLINWGYAVCDASLRSWYTNSLLAPAGFPYPTSGISGDV
jgi:NTE family protein